MKLNNKGITLVEIIISIALISIVLLFIFSLLITVNDINNESEMNSTYLINKALIIKTIEDDLKDASELNIGSCSISNFFTGYDSQTYANYNQKAKMCLKLEIKQGTETKVSYLGLYYYAGKSNYVISYVSDDIRYTKEFPDFEKYNVDSDGNFNSNPSIIKNGNTSILDNGTISSSIQLNNTSDVGVIKIPMIGKDGMDYTFLISYMPNK